MRPRKFLFDEECRKKIFEGIQLQYDVVTRTIGPNGKNVLIDRAGQVVDLTKDGVSASEEIKCKERFVDMGCSLIKESSQKVNEEAGDGTTTVVVLAKEMCQSSLLLPPTASVIKVKRGMRKAVDVVVAKIKGLSRPVKTQEDFAKVASISCQDEELGRTITKAFIQAGENGAIDISRADKPGVEVEKTDGISFEKGWILPACINDQKKNRAIVEEVPVLVTDRAIKSQHILIPILTELAKREIPKLFIIADNIEADALGMIAANLLKKSFYIIPVRAPGFGMNKIGILKDIAEATGATFISQENQGLRLEKTTFEHLGRASKIIVEKDKTIIIAEDSVEIKKRISDRIDWMKATMEQEKMNEIETEELKKRLACLSDGITTIKIEGHTQQEYRELRFRVEDAVRALQSTREEGAVAGCGSTYLQCIPAVKELMESLKDEDERMGAKIVLDSLNKPALRVLEVAGIQDREYLVARMKEENKGYDFTTGELADMMEKNVWDCAKSARCAMEYAASCASSFLTLGVAICDENIIEDSLQQLGGLIKN